MVELDIVVRPLRANDKRNGFCRGDSELDGFFQRFAGQNQFRHYIGVTYVAETQGVLAGFVTVSAGEITTEKLANILRKKLPAYPLPILRIARLAVDQRFQGLGIGKLLLKTMLQLALEQRDRMGCVGVVADAKPHAVAFYASLGFENISNSKLSGSSPLCPMFLPLSVVERSVKNNG